MHLMTILQRVESMEIGETMNGITLGEIMFEELMNNIENVTVILKEEEE